MVFLVNRKTKSGLFSPLLDIISMNFDLEKLRPVVFDISSFFQLFNCLGLDH